MIDGVTDGFRHIPRPAPYATTWRGQAYCHLNVRIDQLSAVDWDFRLFHWDEAWGWDWVFSFARAFGTAVHDMAFAPTTPLLAAAADAAADRRTLTAPAPAAAPASSAPPLAKKARRR